MSCNYKVKIKDIQNKYKFKIFCASNYDDSEIKKMYEAIYMALPKEKASGTSITLNDTAKSYMKNELNTTETSQKTTTGKNLLDTSLLPITKNGITISKNDNGDIVVNGTITGIESGFVSFYIGNVFNVEAGTYTSSLANKRDGIGLNTAGFGGYLNITMSDTIKTKTATATETQTIKPHVNIRYDAGTFNNFILNPMLEKSSTATDYEEYTGGIASPNPSYPQDIHTINGDNTIISEGKNLANPFDIYNGYPYATNGQKIIYYSSANSITYKKCCYIEANQQYTLSWNRNTPKLEGIRDIKIADDNEIQLFNYQYSSVGGVRAVTFTSTASGWAYVSVDANATDVQIEKSNSASEYQPYQSNYVLLTLGDKEICWIGDYKDKIFKAIKGDETYDGLSVEEKNTLDYGKWYLRKATGKVVLDGTENWIRSGNTSESFFCGALAGVSIPFEAKMGTASDSKTNYFVKGNKGSNAEVFDMYNGTDYYTTFALYLSTSRATDVTTFKNWLGTHNVILYYVLTTPTNELFNDAQQEQLEDIYNNMLSYEGQTNISQINNDLPFNINSSALKDLSNL